MSVKRMNAALVHYLYGRLNKLFGKDVEIQRDSLHTIYETSRYGVHVTAEDQTKLPMIRERLIDTLRADGWMSGGNSPLTRHTLYREIDGLYQSLTIDPVPSSDYPAVLRLHPYTSVRDLQVDDLAWAHKYIGQKRHRSWKK